MYFYISKSASGLLAVNYGEKTECLISPSICTLPWSELQTCKALRAQDRLRSGPGHVIILRGDLYYIGQPLGDWIQRLDWKLASPVAAWYKPWRNRLKEQKGMRVFHSTHSQHPQKNLFFDVGLFAAPQFQAICPSQCILQWHSKLFLATSFWQGGCMYSCSLMAQESHTFPLQVWGEITVLKWRHLRWVCIDCGDICWTTGKWQTQNVCWWGSDWSTNMPKIVYTAAVSQGWEVYILPKMKLHACIAGFLW